jgi:hypothetical protein
MERNHFYLIGVIIAIILIIYKYSEVNEHYYGTGPLIFEPDNIFTYYTPTNHLEPVYRKVF